MAIKLPIYMDNHATTPVDPRVLEAMLPYFGEQYGNPSSIYALGRSARRAIDRARDTVAEVLACKPNEVLFTSCGSESDNLAVKGVALAAWERAARREAEAALERAEQAPDPDAEDAWRHLYANAK